MYKNQFVDVL